MLFEVTERDRTIYETQLADFLPPALVDVHTHVWLKSFVHKPPEPDGVARTASWPGRVAADNAIEDLIETYRLMLPGKSVTPILFGQPSRDIDLEETNAYTSRSAAAHKCPALLVSTPAWSAEQVEARVSAGGFLGLKPYLSFAPEHIAGNDITIFDFLPHAHLEVADAHGWMVMLHVPRAARLRDPINVAQLLEIEHRYPHVRLIVAHIGRAYCREDVGNALQALAGTSRMVFDFSANTNAWVMAELLKAVGPRRVLFGTDLPILRMRMRRICENGVYVNLVPPRLYGDVSGDAHMREVGEEEGSQLTFFLYEELLAFRRAAEATGLSETNLQDVFYNNAARLLGWA